MSSVCFVSYYSAPLLFPGAGAKMAGGSEVQQLHLARALRERGVRVCFVVERRKGEGDVGEGEFTVYRSFDRTRTLPLIRTLYPQLARTWRALRRADCEIYYARGARIESLVSWLFCSLYRRRFVAAIAHDRECNPATLQLSGWSGKRWLFGAALRRAYRVIAQSLQQQRALRANMRVESTVVPNVVPLEGEAALVEGLSRLLWVGSIKPSKRPELALELAQRFPELAFTMIGPITVGHESDWEAIRERAARVPNVDFVDYVHVDEIGHHFKSCDLLLQTSESEGFPNVLLQAWACGRAALTAFDPDGIVERHGLGVVARDLEAFDAAIRRLKASGGEAELAALGRNARAYVERHHAPAVVIPQFCAALGLSAPHC